MIIKQPPSLSVMKIPFLAVACICATPIIAAADKDSPPNILFILVDDQRNDTLGCAGHPLIKTPNIDRLAAQGIRFENAFVTTPICMSSRATIFTGMTETGHGYTGGGPPAIPVQAMDIDTSFPLLLREAGYRNGFYGKQHVKFQEGEDMAMKRMFDDNRIYRGGPHFVDLPDGRKRHCDDLVGDHSVDFIRSQPKGQPFFLYMSFNIAHARDSDHRPGIGHYPWPEAADGLYEATEPALPRLGDPRYFEMQPEFLRHSMNRDRWFWRWDTPEKYRINMRAHYRMLTGMDAIIGRVLEELRTQGLAENTVVIYTADNGLFMGNRGFAGKWLQYEESLRVPLIIHDPRPGRVGKGIVSSATVLNLDLPPTLLELAGVGIPKKHQGKSLIPLTHGDTPPDWREEFFCEHHSTNPRIAEWLGIRGKRYTYARFVSQDPVVEILHDRKEDPDQLINLAEDTQHADILLQMRERTEGYVERYSRPEITKLKAEAR
jgi:choline-sulfatase